LIKYLSSNRPGEWVSKSAVEWGEVLPSAPDNANAIAAILKKIAKELEIIDLERGYRGKGRVLRIKIDTGVGGVGGDTSNGHHPNNGEEV
jgi:hypothetical protein